MDCARVQQAGRGNMLPRPVRSALVSFSGCGLAFLAAPLLLARTTLVGYEQDHADAEGRHDAQRYHDADDLVAGRRGA